MPLFGFKKKKTLQDLSEAETIGEISKVLIDNNVISVPKDNNHNFFNQTLNHLDKDGELPFGWVTHNKDFTEPIQQKYDQLLHQWLNSRTKTPKEVYTALSSFVAYMEDIERLCKSKGECFEFWFNEILTGKDYLKKRKQELAGLCEILYK